MVKSCTVVFLRGNFLFTSSDTFAGSFPHQDCTVTSTTTVTRRRGDRSDISVFLRHSVLSASGLSPSAVDLGSSETVSYPFNHIIGMIVGGSVL